MALLKIKDPGGSWQGQGNVGVPYPVKSVNGKTGTVVLDADDINYAENVSVETKLTVTDKTLSNIIELLKGHEYTLTDGTSPVYTDTVPVGAQRYASLGMVGGKSVVWNQLVNYVSKPSLSRVGVSITNNNDGSFILNGTTSSNDSGYNILVSSQVNGHKVLILSNNSNVTLTNNATWSVSPSTIVTANKASFEIGLWLSAGVTYNNAMFYPQVFDLTQMFGSGNEPTTVEQFKAMFPEDYYAYDTGTLISGKCDYIDSYTALNVLKQRIDIPNGIQTLSGYGWSAGTVYNELNFASKKFIKRVGCVDLGSLSWAESTPSNHIFRTTDISNLKTDGDTSIAPNLLCARYESMAWLPISSSDDGKMSCGIRQSVSTFVCIDHSFSDIASFKAAMSGVYLFYELATPVETDVSAYLTDDNYIDTEAGGTVTFHQQDDTRLPLNNKLTYMVDNHAAIGGA